MAIFLPKEELNSSLLALIREAKKELLIISPFIRVNNDKVASNPDYKEANNFLLALLEQKMNHKLEVKIVFRKNGYLGDFMKNISVQDLDLLMKFSNIRISYLPDLHSKVYVNEKHTIASSMNLLDYSITKSEEFGVLSKTKKGRKGSYERALFDYRNDILNRSELVYEKTPQYERRAWYKFRPEYIESKVGIDTLSQKLNQTELSNSNSGFCIITGNRIPFNPNFPIGDLSNVRFEDYNSRKTFYCHLTGESNEKVSFASPIIDGGPLETF